MTSNWEKLSTAISGRLPFASLGKPAFSTPPGFWFKDWLSAHTASSVTRFNLSDANSCHIHLWDMLKGWRDQNLRLPVIFQSLKHQKSKWTNPSKHRVNPGNLAGLRQVYGRKYCRAGITFMLFFQKRLWTMFIFPLCFLFTFSNWPGSCLGVAAVVLRRPQECSLAAFLWPSLTFLS